jgi:stearoyl-CoA desaturase (Delta-9 desaturase)
MASASASASDAANAAAKSRPGDSKKVHIADTELTWDNWHKHVNWLNVTFIIGMPLVGCLLTAWVPLRFNTAVWAVVYYFCTGLGITAGKFTS